MTKKKNFQAQETIVGIITPVQWENDQIAAVALSATDDETYWIENGDKFIDLVRSRIEAIGQVKRDRKTVRSIFIKRFSVIEDA
jgi:hypothetical protein